MSYLTIKPIAEVPTAPAQQEDLQSQRALSFILGSEEEDSGLSTCASDRAQLALESYKERRARDGLFAAELFADPAWDILLILYCASHSQQRLSVTEVCVSAAVPATTALRWIEQLHRLGLLRKKKNPTDARMTWLDLTDEAGLPLDRYFDRILANQISSNLARAA